MTDATRPLVAFIGTGGTMASLGHDTLDTTNYATNDRRLDTDAVLSRISELNRVARMLSVPFGMLPSYDISFADWKKLVALCERLERETPDLAGIVIGHGTSSLEETAYFLNLTLRVQLPVVITGGQRPMNALSSDVPMNLVNAVRVAAEPQARDKGVLVVLNDEINAARDATKADTLRLQTFVSPRLGALGFVDGDRVSFYRAPLRRHYPDTEFDVSAMDALPPVHIVYAYVGSDGTAVDALIRSGARGIVSAGFAPGHPGSAESALLKQAASDGVVVVQSRRAAAGRIPQNDRLAGVGAISADNLNPEKARILLALALAAGMPKADIQRVFDRY